MRNECGIPATPLIIWEPLLTTVIHLQHLELETYMNALKVVDILPPNHIELASFFAMDNSQDTLHISRSIIEHLGNQIVQRGIGKDGKGTMVIRCGPDVCCVWYRKRREWI
ncbi:45108dc9-631c-4538-b904-f48622b8545d-CDS [Sclerotinia trifoliorum]|uniref:45108dc9-631c-4538-b904-f48622b8545d-CDS n=1 Tax=Sclerotinia trifoliorum TaxID=28548 RepID=A0A8H2ZRC8_9HELO|nr:45108dc9-631c-4538-b904-f48622b8545d-CDS [Sclerotinia trifoliorum]